MRHRRRATNRSLQATLYYRFAVIYHAWTAGNRIAHGKSKGRSRRTALQAGRRPRPEKAASDEALGKALQETFPGSDPVNVIRRASKADLTSSAKIAGNRWRDGTG